MKRGWITWDKTEIPPQVFDDRLAVVRQQLAAYDLPALVVYNDVWRSNQGRYLANFMPYWNRALLVIPRDAPPILLCGLSPRVYPWIRSVTILNEIRPNLNLTKLREEKGWDRIGVLDLPLMPVDLAIQNSIDIPWSAIHPEPDETELTMYRRAATMADDILADELEHGAGLGDHEFVARLERIYRRAGAEDLVILISNGATPPAPPVGATLAEWSSIVVAMEYRGHWVKTGIVVGNLSSKPVRSTCQLLSGPYPFEHCEQSDLPSGAIFAHMQESIANGRRIFEVGTYRRAGAHGLEPL